jgi:hypothetical protein
MSARTALGKKIRPMLAVERQINTIGDYALDVPEADKQRIDALGR